MFVPNPTGVTLVAELNTGAVPWTVTQTIDQGITPSPLTLEAAAALFLDWFSVQMTPLLSSAVSLTGVRAYSMASDSAPLYALAAVAPIAGTLVGAPVSVNSALVTTYRTAVRGRSGRGRVYWTGFPEDQLGANLWEVTMVNAVADAIGVWKAEVEAEGWTLVVASKQTAGGLREEALLSPVTGVEARRRLGTQRRRVGR